VRIDGAGFPFVAAFGVPAVVLVAGRRWRLAVPVGALAAFMAAFFRDPDRACDGTPPGADEVLAPADGVVVVAGRPEPRVAPTGDWQQVSIFLSPLDVHMNRTPYGGRVVRTEYRPGRFAAAFTGVAATDNERTEVWLAGDGGRTVVFRQVVGVLARRIVLRVGEGAQLRAGQRIGLMKFGSRMDVFVPRDCTVVVERGDRVRGGETVIARW